MSTIVRGTEIKSDKEIDAMRQAGRILAAILRIMTEQLKPGMKTRELDVIADRELKKHGAKASFKGYHGFPANLCVSVNDEIVHGIPGGRVLHEGDIVSSYHLTSAPFLMVFRLTPP